MLELNFNPCYNRLSDFITVMKSLKTGEISIGICEIGGN